MASLQKYFDYGYMTSCGIPGVEMVGSEEDWIRLAEKTKKLETLLMPIMDEIGLGTWSVFRHQINVSLLIKKKVCWNPLHTRQTARHI